ncbi:MAG: hypothetical protein FVQ79_09895 [Planctomycetes bacterium]|nr:hypothetical protein [Planctomycetota bacterium]
MDMAENYEYKAVKKLTSLTIGSVVMFVILGIAFMLVLTSIVSVGGDEVGIVERKLLGGDLPDGRVLAVDGENGIQAQVLPPGWHIKWKWLYNVKKIKWTEIKDGHVGLLTAKDGRSLPRGTIYAPLWEDPDKMAGDAKYFLTEGNGYKGPQLSVLTPGNYRINTELFDIKQVPIVDVKTGMVAVIKSNVGEKIETEDRLVEVGQRGIWNKPWTADQYYANTNAYDITMIDTRQVKVSYTADVELGERGELQPLKPIIVKTADGFSFPVEVRLIYRIEGANAPKVVSEIGSDEMVLDKLVTPRLRSIFINNAEKVKALDYIKLRSVQEKQSASMLREELAKYGITVLEIGIDAVGDEASLGALLKTQTDREIALQQQSTFEVQQQAAEIEKALKKTKQEAEEEIRLATAAYDVLIAEEEKKQILIEAEAEAAQIKIVAQAKADAYRLIVEAIGMENAALIEIMKLVAENQIRITPEVMVGGSGTDGMTDALMGTIMRDKISGKTGTK